MTITLSDAMQRKLKSAPDYWANLTNDSPSVEALRKRGLVELRTRPGESGMMAGFQWRITEAGCEIDGRRQARFEVTVWDHEGNIVKKAWDANHDEVDEVREQYSDDLLKTIVVEERP
jgi:hypothetical protein